MANDATERRDDAINVSTEERIASATLGLALTIAGLALIVRGATGWCGLYQAIGINTAARASRAPRHDRVLLASEDSFPASDPPAWTPIRGPMT